MSADRNMPAKHVQFINKSVYALHFIQFTYANYESSRVSFNVIYTGYWDSSFSTIERTFSKINKNS